MSISKADKIRDYVNKRLYRLVTAACRIKKAPAGATLAIGTEWKLVDRMRRQNSDKTILYPGATPSVCEDMSKSTLEKVAIALRAWRDGEPINVVTTPDEIAASARKALASLL